MKQSETNPTLKEMAPMAHDDRNEGPLRFLPNPPDVATRRIMKEKLSGHATAANWLPEGLDDVLDELRAEHLRVRDRVVAESRAVAALEQRHRDEDAAYEAALRDSHRYGEHSVEDRRTPQDQREAEHAKAIERYWSAVWVLAERVDAVVAYFREHETEMLAGLRRQREPLSDKRREAQRLLREAETAEWHLAQQGRWVQTTVDGVFGAQPAPVATAPPSTFNEAMLDRALERPWHRQPEAEALPESWLDQESEQTDEIEPLGDGDVTGEVSKIIESEATA